MSGRRERTPVLRNLKYTLTPFLESEPSTTLTRAELEFLTEKALENNRSSLVEKLEHVLGVER